MPRGELYISDNGNGVIRRVNGAGTITTYPIATDFPEELIVDPTGNHRGDRSRRTKAVLLFARTIPRDSISIRKT